MSHQFFYSLPGWTTRGRILLLAVLLAGCAGPTQMPVTAIPTQTIPPVGTPSPEFTPTAAPLTIGLVVSIQAGADALRLPIDLAFDSQGHFYVVDSSNQRIIHYGADGGFLAAWGKAGSGNGEFNFVDGVDGYGGVAVDAMGNVYVADTHNARIQKFDRDGRFLMQWGRRGSEDGEFQAPLGIIVDAEGNAYVSDYIRNDIQKFDSTGRFLLKWGGLGSGDGQFNQLSYLALDSLGNVYVADTYNHRIQKFDPQGGFLAKWGQLGLKAGGFRNPYGIAVDARDFVYVTEYKGDRVQKFDREGNFILGWGEHGREGLGLYEPSGIKIAPDGLIYVADYGNHRIQVFGEMAAGANLPTRIAPTAAIMPPTATPTSPPPIPTADFTPADILGIWTRSDPDRGDLFITILPEGAYMAAHGTIDGIVHSGKFTLDETLFTILDGWNCSPLPQDTPGSYILRMIAGGRFLYFDLYDDICPDRPAALQKVRWTRVVTTPTPQP